MNPHASHNHSKSYDQRCVDLMELAERELSAFFKAVKKLFGSEQAEHSAEDWLLEFRKASGLPASVRELRLITAKVAARLANRVSAPSLSTDPQVS